MTQPADPIISAVNAFEAAVSARSSAEDKPTADASNAKASAAAATQATADAETARATLLALISAYGNPPPAPPPAP